MALVSFVLNNRLEADGKPKYRVGDATRDRILEAARRLGYQRPDTQASLRRYQPRTVVVVLPRADENLCRDIEKMLYPRGITVLFGFTGEDPERLARLRDCGLTVWEPEQEGGPVLEQIQKLFVSL